MSELGKHMIVSAIVSRAAHAVEAGIGPARNTIS